MAELIQAGGNTVCSELYKSINSIWNKEELPQQWKEFVIVLIYKADKTDCSNYRGISLLQTTYKMLSCILLSRLMPYVDKMIGGSSVWVSV